MATGQLVDAIRGEEEDRPLPKVWRNISEEIQAGGISPVQIFEQHEDRTVSAELGEEAANICKERSLVGNPLQNASSENGRRARECGVARVGSHEVEPGTVRRRVRQVVTMAGQHPRAARRRFPGQVPTQCGLADPRLATEKYQPPVTGERGGQFLAQEDLLPHPADDH